MICGSLQPGRDGVGDYCRRLAGELNRLGHEARIIALNDRFVDVAIHEEQNDLETKIVCLRLPASFSNAKKLSAALPMVDEFDPDYLSLQFVPFAFQKKGLPLTLPGLLSKLGNDRKWHIMFHELWVGGCALRDRLLGKWQQLLIQRIIRRLTPTLVTSHLPDFLHKLSNVGSIATPLPLFSNIPVLKSGGHRQEDGFFHVVLFGQTMLNDEIVNFTNTLCKKISSQNSRVVIHFVGEKTRFQAAGAREPVNSLDPRITIVDEGFLSQSKVSQLLSSSVLGISPVPRHALGKSGSVAAFLAHGLPVAAPVTDKDHPTMEIGFVIPELRSCIVDRGSIEAIDLATKAAKLNAVKCSVEVTARAFTALLEAN